MNPAEHQLSLLDVGDFHTPTCKTCGRPAMRKLKSQRYGVYCGPERCRNRERTCRWCNKPFALGDPGAGTKYCSRKCQIQGYHPPHSSGTDGPTRCAWCNAITRGIARRFNDRYAWPYICTPCLEPIKHVVPALKGHRVPHERARQLLIDPGCEVCGANLLERVKTINNQMRARLAVDHDHGCCPDRSKSCGRCVRGLICGPCNTAAGMVRDDPERARALASYLEAWRSRAGD